MELRKEAERIYTEAIRSALPDVAVERALAGRTFGAGRVVLISVGKAGWQMAAAACRALDGRISGGLVITKYGHSRGPLPPLEILEAGHPIRTGIQHRTERHSRRSFGHDRQRSDCPRLIHLHPGTCDRRKISLISICTGSASSPS